MITYIDENSYSTFDDIFCILESQINIDNIDEWIQEYTERKSYFTYSYIREAATDKNLNKIISPKANSKINSTAKDIVDIIKVDGCTAKARDAIHNKIADLFKSLNDFIGLTSASLLNNKKIADADRGKVVKSCVLLVYVALINSLVASILMLLAGPQIGQLIAVGIVAPLVEESGKIISIKGKFDKEYFLVFNTFEFSSYMIGGGISSTVLSKLGLPAVTIKQLFRGRVAAVGMHGLNTIIHKIFASDKFIKNKDNKEEVEDAKDKATTTSFVIGCIIHGTWNFAACLSPAFNNLLMGIN